MNHEPASVLALLVPPSARDTLAAKAAEALALRPQLLALELRTPADEQFAADVRAHLKQRLKDADTDRKSITTHLDAAKKAVDAQYRPEREAIESLITIIDAKLSANETARRARAVAENAARAGTLSEPVALTSRAPEGLTYVDTWEHQSVDLLALVKAVAAGQAPIEFLRLDESAVKIWLRTYKDSNVCPPVPGLAFTRVSKPRAYAGG